MTALTILLIATTASAAVAAIALFNRTGVVDRFLDGRNVALSEIDRADNLVQGTGLLYLLGFFTTGIVFIVWQFRYASNAEKLSSQLGLRPGWAIGGWFIPLAAPVLAAVQMIQADGRSTSRQANGSPARTLIVAWLIILYLGWILNVASAVLRPNFDEGDGTLRDFARADRIGAAGFALITVAGVLALLMVRMLSARQQAAAS